MVKSVLLVIKIGAKVRYGAKVQIGTRYILLVFLPVATRCLVREEVGVLKTKISCKIADMQLLVK